MKKWEYKIHLSKGLEESRDDLNKLGQEGWELVSVQLEKIDICNVYFNLFLKRPIETK